MRKLTPASNQVRASAESSDGAPIGVRVLLIPDVMRRTGLSRATVYRHAAAGLLPKIVHLGKRAVMHEHLLDAALLALSDEPQKAA